MPKIQFGLNKIQTSFYGMVQSKFRYLEPFRRSSQARQIDRDGRTDILLANAVLNYAAQLKLRPFDWSPYPQRPPWLH